jgi:hypothetical protein
MTCAGFEVIQQVGHFSHLQRGVGPGEQNIGVFARTWALLDILVLAAGNLAARVVT